MCLTNGLPAVAPAALAVGGAGNVAEDESEPTQPLCSLPVIVPTEENMGRGQLNKRVASTAFTAFICKPKNTVESNHQRHQREMASKPGQRQEMNCVFAMSLMT